MGIEVGNILLYTSFQLLPNTKEETNKKSSRNQRQKLHGGFD